MKSFAKHQEKLQQNRQQKQAQKRRLQLLTAMVALCALSVAVMIYALVTPKTVMGEFVPPPFEAAAEFGTPQVPDGLGWQEVDAKAYKVGLCGKVIPDGQAMDVWFSNPAENTIWMKLRLLDSKGNLLGETGLIRPGEYVRSVNLSAVPAAGTALVMKVMAYEPETYTSAGVVSMQTVMGGA